MKRLFLMALFFAVVISASSQNKTIRVSPQWLPQAQFAGLYVADSLGFYEELGLDVEIIHPSATHSSNQMLAKGSTDIIGSQLVDALIEWDRGFKMVNVLQCSENNSIMIVSRTPVETLEDLKGKKIGHWKAGFSYLGFILDKRNNLQVEWIPFHSNIALYISGAIDATLAMEYNEYFQLVMSGTSLSESQLVYLRDYGLNVQEDGFYVTPEFLSTNKSEIERFVAATKKGWEWARKKENREKALNIVMAVLNKNNVHSNRVNQEYMLGTILKLQEDADGTAPYKITENRYNEVVKMLIDNGNVRNNIPYDEFVITF